MRYLRLTADIAVAFFFTGSIAVTLATLASALTQRLEPGLQAGILGLLIAAVAFGYSIKRTYWPRTEPGLEPAASALPEPATN